MSAPRLGVKRPLIDEGGDNGRQVKLKKTSHELASDPYHISVYLKDLLSRLTQGRDSWRKISHNCHYIFKHFPPPPLSAPVHEELQLIAVVVSQALRNISKSFPFFSKQLLTWFCFSPSPLGCRGIQ